MSKLSRTPPQQTPSRSESDIQRLCSDEICAINITQRNKRPCPSNEYELPKKDSLTDFKNEIKDMIYSLICAQNTRMDKLESYMIEIKSINSKIEESNLEIEKSMTYVTDQITSLDSKITNLEKERHSISTKMTLLEDKLELYDRSLIKNAVEIRNVPKLANETSKTLYDVMIDLSKTMGMNLQVSDVRDITRQPSKKENPRSALTIDFTNSLAKNNFLSAAKEYNKRNLNSKLNSTHLGFKGPTTPIFIAEQLTSNAKRLFYLARGWAKVHKYMFCWTNNGRIMMKKDKDCHTIVVKCETQLKDLSIQINA